MWCTIDQSHHPLLDGGGSYRAGFREATNVSKNRGSPQVDETTNTTTTTTTSVSYSEDESSEDSQDGIPVHLIKSEGVCCVPCKRGKTNAVFCEGVLCRVGSFSGKWWCPDHAGYKASHYKQAAAMKTFTCAHCNAEKSK